MVSPHRIPTPEPHPRAFGQYANVSLSARRLAAAIAAEGVKLRALDDMATFATVERALVALRTIRQLSDELDAELSPDIDTALAARKLEELP